MRVRKTFTILLLLGCVFATAASAAKFKTAPYPGPVGLEDVPVPQVAVLAEPRVVHLGETIDGIKCQTTEKVAFHIHAHLVIFVDGKERQIPYGIGIGGPWEGEKNNAGPFITQGSCFMWMHTHAADGIIHMEAPKQITFNLGEFFDIWGQKLSRTRVGPAKGPVTVLVDGKIYKGDPRKILLTKHKQIQLEVGTPLVAMETIAFGQL
jgi:hypothetical protein